jgi:copper chaperone
MPDQVNLSIEGMHCDACVRRVRMALGKVEGVEIKDVKVGSAQIAVDPSKTSPEAAIDAVNGIGFTAQRS